MENRTPPPDDSSKPSAPSVGRDAVIRLQGQFTFQEEDGYKEPEIPPVEKFKEKYGGHWGEGHPDYPLEDWRLEVINNDTRLGYWEWAWKQIYGDY